MSPDSTSQTGARAHQMDNFGMLAHFDESFFILVKMRSKRAHLLSGYMFRRASSRGVGRRRLRPLLPQTQILACRYHRLPLTERIHTVSFLFPTMDNPFWFSIRTTKYSRQPEQNTHTHTNSQTVHMKQCAMWHVFALERTYWYQDKRLGIACSIY